MIKATPPAIVIGGGSANGLGIARNLGRQGIPIYCITSDPQEITCRSKYCHGYLIIPQVESNPNILQATLTRLARHISQPAVLFPTTDTAVLTLAQIRETLQGFVTGIPDQAVVETMVRKTLFYPSLQRYRVPHPRTLSPQHTVITDILQQLPFPIYIRPAQSLIFTERFGSKGFLVHTPQEFNRYLAITQRAQMEVLVQEVIPGPTSEGYIVQGYMDQHSQPIVIVAAQKLRQPTLISNQSVQVSIPPSWVADGIQTLIRYFQRIGYRGLFGAEFKRDPRDGVFKLLEVNARSMGGISFVAGCGANDVLAAYRDILGHEISPILTYKTGVYFIDEVEELGSILSLRMQRQLSTQELLRPYRARQKVINYSSRDDLLPLLAKITQILRQLPERFSAMRARI